MLILAGILATSDGKTQFVVGLPGDVIHDGGCKVSFGTDIVRKERKVGVDRPPAMHHNGLEAGALLGIATMYGTKARVHQTCLLTVHYPK